MVENKDNESTENIIPRVIQDELQTSFMDYAMSVIISRALPDARDGLKPVHRRILHTMNELGLAYGRAFKKSARIVGDCMGKYHPHGDQACYDALVRMGQDFSLRFPLVDGQGNFGSIDGDNAAAMRYTEARLAKLSGELLEDLEKDTVDFGENFDGSLKEPKVLPAKIPNLLINGSSGIAVGMATNIPPHNLSEVVQAVSALIDNPQLEVGDLMEYIQGPDFPTGAQICGTGGLTQAYKTGRGKIICRAIINEEKKGDRLALIVSEIPYQVNKSMLIEEIANLVREKHVEGISDLRDESDRKGMRIVIELKRDANAEVVKNALYKHSRLQETFGANILALVDNQPKILDLKSIINCFIEHRREVVIRRTKFDLAKAEDRSHLLEGLIIALSNIDAVIKLIRGSPSGDIAKKGLITKFSLSDRQASAILEMRLQRLTGMEQDKIKEEHAQLQKLIAEYKGILGSDEKVRGIIKGELQECSEKYGNERRTKIGEAIDEIDLEDLIDPEDMAITVTHSGYIKRIPLSTYKAQRRGGKGIIGTGTKEEDIVSHLFVANTHSFLLFFTTKGKVHWKKVYYLPEGSRTSKGKAIINLLQLDKDESISAMIPIHEFSENEFLVMATKKGVIKKTPLTAFSRPRQGGIIAATLLEGDEIVNVVRTDGTKDIMIASAKGQAVRFPEGTVRPMGRTSRGVRGMKIQPNDYVVSMVIAEKDKTVMTVTENGFGKRTKVDEYRLTNRGVAGVRNIVCSARNGKVVDVRCVDETHEVMFISKNGIIIRSRTSDISVIGRNTQGVRLMRLKGDDVVVAAAKVITENDDPEENEEEEVATETPTTTSTPVNNQESKTSK